MCKSNKTNLCGAVRKWTGNGIMKADDGVRFHHKESGKKIYHFVSSLRRFPLSAPCLLDDHASSLYPFDLNVSILNPFHGCLRLAYNSLL